MASLASVVPRAKAVLTRQSWACRSSAISARHSTRPLQRLKPVCIFSAPIQKAQRCSYSAASGSVQAPDYLSPAELEIFNKLNSELEPVKLEVRDISGGCGSMYGLDIVSAKFNGMPLIKQHQLVNKLLSDKIKGWHGMQLKTKAP